MNTEGLETATRPFDGLHCETVATGTLLLAEGIELSEAMLFGLGEGLGFVFLNLSSLPLPFVGGRVKPFELTRSLAKNLGLTLEELQTTSRKKGWESLERVLSGGRPAGLQLDCFYLDYFENAPHFAGHCVAAYHLDDAQVWVVDTRPQGTLQRVSRESLEDARHAKGPMAARARQWTLHAQRTLRPIEQCIATAIRSTAAAFLQPAFGGASYRGMDKLAKSLPRWIDAKPEDRMLSAMLMERGGTGGALFRNLYRDFLSEAVDLLPLRQALRAARDDFAASAECWTQVAGLVEESARCDSGAPLSAAADKCRGAAAIERRAMERLQRL